MNLLTQCNKHLKRQPADFSYLSGSSTPSAFSQSIEQLNRHVLAGLQTYTQYVRKDISGLWKARRELYYDFYKHTCQVCHRRKATQVHHKTYSHVGRENLDELIPLCGTCHRKEHNL